MSNLLFKLRIGKRDGGIGFAEDYGATLGYFLLISRDLLEMKNSGRLTTVLFYNVL